MPVNPVPDGYHSVTPYVHVDGGPAFIDFMAAAFGAKERQRMPMPDGKLAHAEIDVGDSVIMLADGTPEYPARPCTLLLYLDDVDGTYQRALAAGATSQRQPEDQFYGDRAASVADPFGNTWYLHTHTEDVSDEELERRMAAQRA